MADSTYRYHYNLWFKFKFSTVSDFNTWLNTNTPMEKNYVVYKKIHKIIAFLSFTLEPLVDLGPLSKVLYTARFSIYNKQRKHLLREINILKENKKCVSAAMKEALKTLGEQYVYLRNFERTIDNINFFHLLTECRKLTQPTWIPSNLKYLSADFEKISHPTSEDKVKIQTVVRLCERYIENYKITHNDAPPDQEKLLQLRALVSEYNIMVNDREAELPDLKTLEGLQLAIILVEIKELNKTLNVLVSLLEDNPVEDNKLKTELISMINSRIVSLWKQYDDLHLIQTKGLSNHFRYETFLLDVDKQVFIHPAAIENFKIDELLRKVDEKEPLNALQHTTAYVLIEKMRANKNLYSADQTGVELHQLYDTLCNSNASSETQNNRIIPEEKKAET